MAEKQVRSEKKQVRKLKTRCYYTDYVNHAIRFYLSCPDSLQTAGKRKADIENWISVQTVFHFLTDTQRQILAEIYKLHHRLPEGVRMYCEKTGTDENQVWLLVTKVNASIARKRGLI